MEAGAINTTGATRFEVDFYLGRTMKHAILEYQGGSFRTIVYSDDIAPGTSGAQYGRNINLLGFNAAGDTAFLASLTQTPQPPLLARPTIFLAPASGPIVRLAGHGDAAPGTGGGTLSQISPVGFNEQSEVLFSAAIVGGPGGYGLFVASTSGVRKIVASGDSDLAGGTFACTTPSFAAGMNNAGQVAFLYGSRAYVSTPGTGLELKVDPATSPLFPSLSWNREVTLVVINDAGDMAVVIAYRVTGGDYWHIIRVPVSGSPDIVASIGDAAPRAGVRTFSSRPNRVVMNGAGTVGFDNTLSGLPRMTGLFTNDPGGSVTAVVLDGDSALGGTISGLSSFRLYGDGSVYYEAGLAGASADFATFLASGGTTTVLTTSAETLPAGSSVALRNLWIAASGNYAEFSASHAGAPPALFLYDTAAGTTTRVAGEGDVIPGVGRLSGLSGYWVAPSANGTAIFPATVVGQTGRALFARTAGGSMSWLIGPGDSITGISGTVRTVPSPSTYPFLVNDIDQAAAVVTFTSGQAIVVVGPTTTPTKVVVYGDAAPGGGTFTSVSSGAPRINLSGQVAFVGTTNTGTTGIFVASPGGSGYTIAKVVAVGDTFTGGGTFSTVHRSGAGVLAFNDAGQVLFTADLTGGPGGGLFIASVGTPPQAVALNGSPAPAGGNYNFTANQIDVRMNNAGAILFRAPLTGGSADSGLFLRRAGSPTIETVAVQGQAAPGTAGRFYTIMESLNSIPGELQALGPDGALLFFNYVDIGGVYPVGLYRYRTDGTLELLVLRGDPMPDGRPGLVAFVSQGPGAGVAGRSYFRLAAVDGSSVVDGIFMTALPGDPITAPAPLPSPAPNASSASHVYQVPEVKAGATAARGVGTKTGPGGTSRERRQ